MSGSTRHSLGQAQRRLSLAATRLVERRRARVELLAGRLQALSPLATLGRGYAVARGGDGVTLGSRAQIPPGMTFELWLHDGIVSAEAGDGRALPEILPQLSPGAPS